MVRRVVAVPGAVPISERDERRARWVLDMVGAPGLRLGENVPYRPEAWEAVERGELPHGDELAAGFFHLARVEERGAERDRHGRFLAASSCLDPLDPPLERLRRELGVEQPRYRGARFAVALTHDVDVPWRWTRIGVLGAAARLKGHAFAGRAGPALHEARGLARVPLHKARRTDPNWRFAEISAEESEHGARSTFFVMAGHTHRADGAAPEAYDRLRPRLVETLLGAGAGVGFRYDTSLGFPDALGFRAGIAHPFRPWDFERERPADLVEVPLAVMDATLAEERYAGLSAAEAKPRVVALLDWAAEHGGAFSILWHPERFDGPSARGWDSLYFELIEAVRERGGICLAAGELAGMAAERFGLPRD